MNLIIEYASVEDIKDIKLPYFNFFTALYGRSMVTNAIGRRLESCREISPLLEFFDQSYVQSAEAIESTFGDDEYLTMIKISTTDYIDPHTGKPQVLAYGRLNWALEGIPLALKESMEDSGEYTEEQSKNSRNNKNAGVHEVALAVPMSDEQAEEFYFNFAIALENWIAERNENVEIVSHEVPRDNYSYLNAMFDLGDYSYDSYKGSLTVMFDKYIRNKPLSRKIKQ